MSKTTRAFPARSTSWPVCRSVGRRACEQIVEKERAQGFYGLPAHARKIARESRAGGQFLAVEQRHEWLLPRLQRLIDGFQGAFAADRVAEQDGHKVEDFVASEAAAGKADSARVMASRTRLFAQVSNNENHFSKPGRGQWGGAFRGLDADGRIRDTGHWSSLPKEVSIPSFVRRHILGWLAPF
jgi:hypothetical protein